MTAIARIHPRPGPIAVAACAAAVPLAGWTTHALVLHRRLAVARRDPLTGALARDGFTARARQILTRYGDDTLVVLVDLDHFKAINDTRGHAAGDAVLAATGARLRAWAGKHGTVGRLGGDEFAIALRVGPARRQIRLDQLMAALSAPVDVGGALVDVAASIGAASPGLLPGVRDLPGLLRAADTAMYAGKHTGHPVLAGPQHTSAPSVNGRRAGRPGTAHPVVSAA